MRRGGPANDPDRPHRHRHCEPQAAAATAPRRVGHCKRGPSRSTRQIHIFRVCNNIKARFLALTGNSRPTASIAAAFPFLFRRRDARQPCGHQPCMKSTFTQTIVDVRSEKKANTSISYWLYEWDIKHEAKNGKT